MASNVLIQSFSPFPTFSISAPPSAQINDIYTLINARYPSFPLSLANSLVFSTNAGHVLSLNDEVSSLRSGDALVTLRLTPRLLGGKGGFGSQLRAAGGRMSSQKTSNNDSCRDLSGRRLSTIKEAKKLADYIEHEPARLAAKAEAEKLKLENLERKLGITPSSSKNPETTAEVLSGKKHRFDDTEYLEKTNELKEGVKNAVSVALLKKKKKAKVASESTNDKEIPSKDAKEIKGAEKPASKTVPEEKVSTVIPVVVAVALDAVGA
ncbi:hypothetical protein BDN70DRAFT_859350 [Pholiota conissans]|uniref:Sde2 N-terminal ubiquitin domain-containing protein n=1 Tax=Pholiota conissans TaxID=109636 RepID=A0A9P5Z241_9AGAR|nr:hypothetical protein BDN70DRAFT_859350 [Pholiota conissans]